MTVLSMLDAAGRRRSPATIPGYHTGRPPRNKGMHYPADPPTVDEIVAVMRRARDDRHGWRLRAMIVVLWRGGSRGHPGAARPRALARDHHSRSSTRKLEERPAAGRTRVAVARQLGRHLAIPPRHLRRRGARGPAISRHGDAHTEREPSTRLSFASCPAYPELLPRTNTSGGGGDASEGTAAPLRAGIWAGAELTLAPDGAPAPRARNDTLVLR
jgi:hypothetical protein